MVLHRLWQSVDCNHIIFQLACSDLLPLPPPQLANVLHMLAELPGLRTNGVLRQGSIAQLLDLNSQRQYWLQLGKTGPHQARCRQIPLLSPLCAALLGSEAEQDVQLKLLGRTLQLRIQSVITITPLTRRNAL